MGFNNFLNNNNAIKKEYTKHKISDSIFESICSDLFQTDDESKIKMSKLDKRRKANLVRDYDDELMSQFKKDGYISLNTFCDLFRTDIKMNYNTLYKRLNNNNENIPQYINDKEYILSYKKVNKSTGLAGSRVYTIVNYERYGDFIDCIVKNFLNKEQKEFEIVSGV